MIMDDTVGLNNEVVLFIRREAARETQGTIVGQAGRHLAKPLVDAPQGAQVGAPELRRMVPVLDKITDPTLRNKVQGYFVITTKYQALNMLVAEHSPLRLAQPEVCNELILAATYADRKGQAKAGRNMPR